MPKPGGHIGVDVLQNRLPRNRDDHHPIQACGFQPRWDLECPRDPALVLKVAGKNELFHWLHASWRKTGTSGNVARDPNRTQFTLPACCLNFRPADQVSHAAPVLPSHNEHIFRSARQWGLPTHLLFPSTRMPQACSKRHEDRQQYELEDIQDNPANTTDWLTRKHAHSRRTPVVNDAATKINRLAGIEPCVCAILVYTGEQLTWLNLRLPMSLEPL